MLKDNLLNMWTNLTANKKRISLSHFPLMQWPVTISFFSLSIF